MAESEHGEYIRASDHIAEVQEWSDENDKNRKLAETLLEQSDIEIENKNKEIFKLKSRVADLMEDVK